MKIAFALLPLTVLIGCQSWTYRDPIQQGNALSDTPVDAIEVGMSHSQVTALLGDTVFVDPFHSNELHYISYEKIGHNTPEHAHWVITLDDYDTVIRVKKQ